MSLLHLVPKALRRAQLTLIRKDFARAVSDHRITLLGDSITAGLGRAEHLVNLGVHGETSHGLLRSLPYYEHSVGGAGAVLLMIGTNDAWQNKTENIEHRLEAIANAIPDNKPLIWSAIPPAGHFSFNLRRVHHANKHIEHLANSRARTTFVDTWQLFTDARGLLIRKYFLEDQVHLSPAGYRRWTSALKSSLNQHRPSNEGLSFGQPK